MDRLRQSMGISSAQRGNFGLPLSSDASGETESTAPSSAFSLPVTCEGYCFRKASWGLYQKRYLTLSGSILYASTDRDGGHRGSNTQSIEVGQAEPFPEKPYGFLVRSPAGSDAWYCYAESEADCQRWLAALQRVQTAGVGGAGAGGVGSLSLTTKIGGGAGGTGGGGGGAQLEGMPEFNAEGVTFSGYLVKQGHRRKNWRRRFFVLRGSSLSYYEDQEKARVGAKPKKTVVVTKVRDYSEFSPRPEWSAFSFMFYTADGEPYYVCAENNKQRQRWIAALDGSRQQSAGVRCDICKAIVKANQKFCGICGAKVAGGDDDPTAGASIAGASRKLPGAMDSRASLIPRRASPPEEQIRASMNFGRRTSSTPYTKPMDDSDVPAALRARGSVAVRRRVAQSANDIPAVATVGGGPPSSLPGRGRPVSDREIPSVYTAGVPRGSPTSSREAVPAASPPLPPPRAVKSATDIPAVRTAEQAEEEGQAAYDVDMESPAPGTIEAVEENDETSNQELFEGARTLLLAVLKTEGEEGVQHRDSSIVSNDITEELAQTRIEEEEKVVRSASASPPPSDGGIILGKDKERQLSPVDVKNLMPISEESASSRSGGSGGGRRSATAAAGGRESGGAGDEEEAFANVPVDAPPASAVSRLRLSDETEFRSVPVDYPPRGVEERGEEGGRFSEDPDAFLNVHEASDYVPVDERISQDIPEAYPPPPRGLSSRVAPPRALEMSAMRGGQGGERERNGQEYASRSPEYKASSLFSVLESQYGLRPSYIPSDNSVLRCKIYWSPNAGSAASVVAFVADSGQVGLWKQESAYPLPSREDPWSMEAMIASCLQAGYAVLLSNPYSNTSTVFEEGVERVLPVPQSSTPLEHMNYLWNTYLLNCQGQVSFIAYGRGGSLVKTLLQTHEIQLREKLHRIAFIESKHIIDKTETYTVLQLLAKKAINWEIAQTTIATQLSKEQGRVGCVCLSLPPPDASQPSSPSHILRAAQSSVMALLGTDPAETSMTAIVKAIRAVVRPPSSSPLRPSSSPIPRRESAFQGFNPPAVHQGPEPAYQDSAAAMTYAQQQPSPYDNPYDPSLEQKEQEEDDSANLSVDTDFDLKQVIGQGGFGKVFLVRKKTGEDAGTYYAMKVLLKKSILSSGLVKTTMAERRILTEINHPFIVKLHYAFQNDQKLYLVMGYMSGGSLNVHLRKWRKFPEQMAKFYAAEIALAIHHLHNLNIIYRDAKLENVLLDSQGHVAITDFGLSKIGVSGLRGAKTFCGTAAYIAPELLKGQAYGKAADWWSFGVLLYEMIAGRPPYYHKNREIMFQTILKQEWVTFSAHFSDAAVDIVQRLLIRDPLRRLGGRDVFRHRFFHGINWEAVLQKQIRPPYDPKVGEDEVAFVPRHIVQQELKEPSLGDKPGLARQMKGVEDGKNHFEGFSFARKPNASTPLPAFLQQQQQVPPGRYGATDQGPPQRSPPPRNQGY